MDEFYRDILSDSGRQPREFGAVQVHVDPIARGRSGARAAVWLQAAFEGARGSLKAFANEAPLGEWPLPDLSSGKVVRLDVALSVPPEAREVVFKVDAPAPDEAERVRPPWKLFDTLEIAVERELRTSTDSLAFIAGRIAMGGLVSRAALSGGATQSEKITMKRHAARALPDGFAAEVVDSEAAPAADGTIVVWEQGQPFEPAKWRPAVPSQRLEGQVRCGCGVVVPRGAEFCPSCLSAVSAAPLAMPPEPEPPAPALAPGSPLPADPVPVPQPDAPAPNRAQCAAHPASEDVRTCPRCGTFYCDECYPDSLSSERTLCPGCRKRELEPEAPELRRVVLRDMALVLCGLAGAYLVLMVALPFLMFSDQTMHLTVINGLVLATAVLVLAGLVALVRHAVAGWIAAGLIALLLLQMVLTGALFHAAYTGVAEFMLVLGLLRLRRPVTR